MTHFHRAFATLLVASLSLGSMSAQDLSVMFPGNSRIRVNDAPQLDMSTSLSLEAWIYPVAKVSDYPVIIHKPLDVYGEPWNAYSIVLSDQAEGEQHPIFSISDGVQAAHCEAGGDPVPLYQWTHIAATYSGDTMRIYMNGELRGQTPASLTIVATVNPLFIGRAYSVASNHFRGFIDEVRIWNVARSATQIQTARNQNLSLGDRAGLVAYYQLNGPSETTAAYDSSGFGNNGTLYGGAFFCDYAPSTAGGTPQISISPTSFALGNVEQGEDVPIHLNVINNGSGTLVGFVKQGGSNISLPGTFLFYVGPSWNYEFSLALRPLVAGPTSDVLTVTSNAGELHLPVTAQSIAVNQFDANRIGMWVQRDGQFSRDPLTRGAGLEWPISSGQTAVYSSGIWIGALVNSEVRVSAAFYTSGFDPGPIQNGQPADRSDARYRVYKISAGDNAGTNLDYAEWPSDLGAPANPDGSPQLTGDQTLWTVYNDADPDAGNSVTSATPLGAEVQQTIFGFNDPNGPLGNTVFMRFRIINKSSSTWQNAYVGLWSDPDVGNPSDDAVCSDSVRSLVICYNGDNDDEPNPDNGYGAAPPAVGYTFLEHSGSSPLRAFTYFVNASVDSTRGDPNTPLQAYNYLQGLDRYGSPTINPGTGTVSSYAFSGDPVTGNGWVDHDPRDKRVLLTTGPFNLTPGQSREIFAAVMVARGASNLASVQILRQTHDVARKAFETGLVNAPQLLEASDVPNDQGGKAILRWRASTLDHDVRILPRYSIWRAVPWELTAGDGAKAAGNLPSNLPSKMVEDVITAGGPYAWERWAEQEALRLPYYSCTVPTLYDSMSTTTGKHYFMIVAHTSDSNVFFLSNIDSAASVDNLPPGVPQGLTARVEGQSIVLEWQPTEDSDIGQYEIYRGIDPGIDPDAVSSVGATADATFVDAGAPVTRPLYYVVRARDVHENYGKQSLEIAVVTTGIPVGDGILPTEFGLDQNYPNPFNPHTTIRFAIPYRCRVSLEVFDMLGHKVAMLVNRELPAGYHHEQWRVTVPSGMYTCRFEAVSVDDPSKRFVDVKKMILLK